MPNYLIDTHCHLHDPEFYTPEQTEECLVEARAHGVEQMIVIGTSHADSLQAQSFAAAHAGVFWTYGIHPESASSDPFDPSTKLPAQPIAIGEVGLDCHYDDFDRTAQIHLFEQMLQLAHDLDLPVSLHIRDAFADAWPVIDNFPGTRGVVHSFTGNKKELRRALDRGFYIGVNGLATYSTLPLPPLEKIVLETDAPFLTPVPFRGTMNKPGYVRFVADYLSEQMGVAKQDLVEQTTNNARQLFNLEYPVLRPGEDL